MRASVRHPVHLAVPLLCATRWATQCRLAVRLLCPCFALPVRLAMRLAVPLLCATRCALLCALLCACYAPAV